MQGTLKTSEKLQSQARKKNSVLNQRQGMRNLETFSLSVLGLTGVFCVFWLCGLLQSVFTCTYILLIPKKTLLFIVEPSVNCGYLPGATAVHLSLSLIKELSPCKTFLQSKMHLSGVWSLLGVGSLGAI